MTQQPHHIVPALKSVLAPPTDDQGATTEVITLTPEDDLAILTHMGFLGEHDIDPDLVRTLADSMEAGEWLRLSQLSILISDTGEPHLVDGHHRLHAAILAGWTGPWCVTCYWDLQYSVRDLHLMLNSVRIPRTDADIARVLG